MNKMNDDRVRGGNKSSDELGNSIFCTSVMGGNYNCKSINSMHWEKIYCSYNFFGVQKI